jgi:hypothetical protein
MKVSERAAIEEDMLSLEHVPPEKAGGNVQTLTCKKCNNDDGALLDSQLARKLEIDDINRGGFERSLDATIELNGVRLRVEVYLRDDGRIEIIPPERVRLKSSPQVDALTREFLTGEAKGSLTYHSYNPLRSNASIIRSAYLYAFSVFGYGFLIETQLAAIRACIKHPEENVLPTPGIIYLNFPDAFLGVNVVTAPKEAKAFLIVLDLLSDQGMATRVGVILPGPTRPGLNVYHWLSGQVNKEVALQINHHIEDFDFNEYPLVSHDIWGRI